MDVHFINVAVRQNDHRIQRFFGLLAILCLFVLSFELVASMINFSGIPFAFFAIHQQWNATLPVVPIVPKSIASQLVPTSATAASLLVAVLVFLYNSLRDLMQQEHDAYAEYLRTRLTYQRDMKEKMKRTTYTLTPTGGAGTKKDFDFEWTYEILNPVSADLARPEAMLADFEKLFKPDVETSLVDSVNRGALYDFGNENWLDSIILKQTTYDVRIFFIWVFDRQSPASYLGTLHVQSAYVSTLRKKAQSLSKSLRVMSYSIVTFVAAIAFSFLSEFLDLFGLIGLAAYCVGWGMLLFGVSKIVSLIPKVYRRRKREPPSQQIVVEIPAEEDRG